MTDLKTELKRSQKLASKAIFNKDLDSYDDFKKFLRLYLVQEALKPSSVTMIDRNSRFYQDWNDQTRAKCGSIKSIPDLIPFFKRFAKETKLDLNIDDTFVDPLDTQIYFSWLNRNYDKAHPFDD